MAFIEMDFASGGSGTPPYVDVGIVTTKNRNTMATLDFEPSKVIVLSASNMQVTSDSSSTETGYVAYWSSDGDHVNFVASQNRGYFWGSDIDIIVNGKNVSVRFDTGYVVGKKYVLIAIP